MNDEDQCTRMLLLVLLRLPTYKQNISFNLYSQMASGRIVTKITRYLGYLPQCFTAAYRPWPRQFSSNLFCVITFHPSVLILESCLTSCSHHFLSLYFILTPVMSLYKNHFWNFWYSIFSKWPRHLSSKRLFNLSDQILWFQYLICF